MRILFITANYIGDALRTSGVLYQQLKQYPGAKVTVVCGPPAAPLFKCVPNLEDVIILRKKRFSKHWLELWAHVVRKQWTVVIDARRSGVGHFLWRKKLITEIREKVEGKVAPHLWIGESERQMARKLVPVKTYPAIAIAPTTTKHAKEWQNENFITLLDKLTGKGGIFENWRVVVAAAPSEYERLTPLLNGIAPARRIVLKESLLTVAACIERCHFFIGCDSALMHIAACLGVPTLGLFGPTRVEHYAPIGPFAATVQTDKSVDELLKNVDYENAGSLMDSLSPDKVVKAVEALWQSLPEDKKHV